MTLRIMNRKSYEKIASLESAFDWGGVYIKYDTNEEFCISITTWN